MKLVDTHCHLDDPSLRNDLDSRLAKARTDGVCAYIVPAIYQEQWQEQAEIVAMHPDLYSAYGLHPCYMQKHRNAHVAALEEKLVEEGAIAVGEIGLDFYLEHHDPHAQQEIFEAQLGVAANLNLPVLLHARKSHDILLKYLRKSKLQRGGIVHAFSGSLAQAERLIDLGYLIGFGGGATYDRAQKLHSILKALPLSAIVLETDAPDIPPSFARDVPNTPEHLLAMAKIIAERKDVSLEDLASATTANAERLFGLKFNNANLAD
ncbi:Mg-dependent DNase [gamma proteobacterium HdN1]|nr:Mg-dependent DNase [gamma proteobacterium HdN1]